MSRRSRGGRLPGRDRRTLDADDFDGDLDGDRGDQPALDGTPPTSVGGAAPTEQELHQQAMDRSFRLLAVRGRTVAELTGRLRVAGFDAVTIDRVIARLGELEYLDDAAFARAWVAERGVGGRASGRHRLAWELAQKGVAKPAIEAALTCYTPSAERAAALRVARGILNRKTSIPPDRMRQRIYQALARRGFDREAIDEAFATIGPQLVAGTEQADDPSPDDGHRRV